MKIICYSKRLFFFSMRSWRTLRHPCTFARQQGSTKMIKTTVKQCPVRIGAIHINFTYFSHINSQIKKNCHFWWKRFNNFFIITATTTRTTFTNKRSIFIEWSRFIYINIYLMLSKLKNHNSRHIDISFLWIVYYPTYWPSILSFQCTEIRKILIFSLSYTFSCHSR